MSEGAANPWFAVHVRSRREKLVTSLLQSKGYPVFLPLYKARHRWSDRMKEVELPLFTSYVFCSFDPAYRLPILTTPGVVAVIGSQQSPTPVTEAELESIRRIVNSGVPSGPWPHVKEGERVYLRSGPLAGLEGLVIRTRNEYRFVVSVSLLNRSVAVEIDRDWAQPVAKPRSRSGGANNMHN